MILRNDPLFQGGFDFSAFWVILESECFQTSGKRDALAVGDPSEGMEPVFENTTSCNYTPLAKSESIDQFCKVFVMLFMSNYLSSRKIMQKLRSSAK